MTNPLPEVARRELLRQLLAAELGPAANEHAPHPDDWLPVDDTLPIAARTVRDAIKEGDLVGYQLDRTTLLVRRRDLDAWIERHRVQPRTKAPRPDAPPAEATSPEVAALAGKFGLQVK